MIDGVVITPLRRIPDERGKVMHILKSSDDGFVRFGEVYCSTVFPGVVKGWTRHREMTLNYAVVSGMIKLVLFDGRRDAATHGMLREIYVGDDHYVRVTVPPGVWYGFKGVGTREAFIINVTDLPHDPDEMERMDPHDNPIPYDWGVRER